MRAGVSPVQPALTPEAAATMNQAAALARQPGCGGPILGQHLYPSASNALVAALKRAGAHQRRESVEQQQQQQSSIRIGLGQLVVSILDDPSVSRVMREAGFSSAQVKSNVEDAINYLQSCKGKKVEQQVTDKKDDNVDVIIESLLAAGGRERRSLVIVGENVSTVQTAVKKLMDRVDRGEVPDELKEVKFITIPPFYSFFNLERHSVEKKMVELGELVRSLVSKGVVLHLGDLDWVSRYRVSKMVGEEVGHDYCPVDHLITEIGRLVFEIVNGRFWVIGVADFEAYTRCKNGYSSLEDVWGLHMVTVPPVHAGLGLSIVSPSDEHSAEARRGAENAIGHQQLLIDEEVIKLTSSLSPSLSTSCFSFDPHNPKPLISCSTTTSSPSSSGNNSTDAAYSPKFIEFSSQSLNILCSALEKKVPWQKEIIPEIAATILQCRSGMLRRKHDVTGNSYVKSETWLLFLGPDALAKEIVSRHLAKTVFDSCSNFVSIGISSFASSTEPDALSEDHRKKRVRDEQSCCSYIDRFAQAVSENPHRVFLLEDLEQADRISEMRIRRAIGSGRIASSTGIGEEAKFCDAIVVLSCEAFRLGSRACSPCDKEITDTCDEPLDLNISFDVDDEDHGVVDQSVGDHLGILEGVVDRSVVFKIQKL
ncbi:Double Clp-N motif-containing P-loop nucleoside triphosphate hydrolases superfamily protein [Striga hermonthica]|uniref:Double Clp-N motif-containing P-loop nucleoside triphosphate hydrolases superfamily protein n=1 Tax=Striga hermonthica TaxID=68872 RepID=A0A9N7NWK9_STRHE|nr:Double Clp-N motif-containing P-loop nucleoside triphosphate hydrolases superfamily protein [Striga hermonthica]